MNRFMRVIICLVVVSQLMAAAVMGQAANSTFQLNIVFSTDVRGRMLPIDTTQADCTPTQVAATPGKCYGGVSRRATFIAQARDSFPNTLAIDVGNYFYGTSFMEVSNPPGADIAHWVSQSQYDILGVGTNEFFNGPATYANFLNALTNNNPQVVCSNIDVSKEPLMPQNIIQPWTVLVKSGRKIGVVGAINSFLAITSSPGPNINVNHGLTRDYEQELTAQITAMLTSHPDVNIIILVTTAARSDVDTIANTVDNIDIILYKSSDATDLPTQVVQTTTIFGAPRQVVLATVPETGGTAGFGATVGNIILNYDLNGNVTQVSGGTVLLNNATAIEDPTIWSEVQADYVKVAALNNVVVGQVSQDLGESSVTSKDPLIWCRASDCNLGRLVTDAMLYWCQDCDVAHTNSGGLRANLYQSTSSYAPNVTRGDINKILPFGNNFVTYTILGKDFIQTVLTASLAKYKTGGWQQYAGVRWAWNDNSVAYVSIYSRATASWTAMDPQKLYKIVTLNFILPPSNGDGYNIHPTLAVNLYGPPAVDAVGTWLGSAAFVPPPTLQELALCGINTTFVLTDTTGNGNISWPLPQCTTVHTSGTISLPNQCPTNLAFCRAGGEVYQNKPFNTSTCSQCSGLGTCITGFRRCACDPAVTSGLFQGITMIAGDDCSIIRQEYVISAGLKGFLYFLSAVSILVAVCASIFFYVYREAKVNKRAAILFLQITCLGGLLGGCSAISMIINTTDQTCQAANWLGNLGWVLMFGALFIKTWRIFAIFGNKRLKTIVLTDSDMLMKFGAVILIEVILRVVETLVSAPIKKGQQLGNCQPSQNLLDLLNTGSTTTTVPSNFYYYFTCGSDLHKTFDIVNWAWKASLTVWGCGLAFFIKDIQEDFNESKLLALVIYNMAIFAVIARVIIEFIGSDYPAITLAVEVLAVNYVVICTILGISLPKYLLIRRGAVGGASQSHVSKTGGVIESTNQGSRTGGQGGRSGHDTEENTINVTMNPTGRVTPGMFMKTLETIRNRLRTSAADRTTDLPLFLEQVNRFADQLKTLQGGSGAASTATSSSGSSLMAPTFTGRANGMSVISRGNAPSVARALQPRSTSTTSRTGGNNNSISETNTSGVELGPVSSKPPPPPFPTQLTTTPVPTIIDEDEHLEEPSQVGDSDEIDPSAAIAIGINSSDPSLDDDGGDDDNIDLDVPPPPPRFPSM